MAKKCCGRKYLIGLAKIGFFRPIVTDIQFSIIGIDEPNFKKQIPIVASISENQL